MKSKKKLLIGLFLVVIILAFGGVGYYFLSYKADKKEKTSVEIVVDPALYQACDEDSCIYLLGTIHVGDSKLVGLTDKIWNAYNNSDAIAFELDITTISAEESEDLIYLPIGDDLSNHLSQEQMEKLQNFLAARLITIDVVRQFNLAGIASLLQQLAYLELGYLPNNGVDQQLLEKAHSDSKEIIELETYELQAALLYQFKEEYYLKQIDEILENYSMVKNSTKLLYQSYLSGNVLILRELFGSSEGSDELEKEYNQKMLIDRNLNMAEKAETFLKENRNVMIAVGSAHVVGEKGLVDLLEERGYKVSLVK